MKNLADDPGMAAQEAASKLGPRIGEVYEHYKGGQYTVIARPLFEATLTPMVVYRNRETGACWARTLDEFNATVHHVDRRLRRFLLVASALATGGEGSEPR